MVKNVFDFSFITLFCYLILSKSQYIDVEQLFFDLEEIRILSFIDGVSIFIFIAISVSILTILLNYIFKPFIEIYLQHYLRYSFYFLINLLSISTIFITYRIYGYSRFYLLLYILGSSTIFYLSDKNYYLDRLK